MYRPTRDAADYQEERRLNIRIGVMQALVGAVLLLYLMAFWYLQVVKHDYYRRLSDNNRLRRVTLTPLRGLITDTEWRLTDLLSETQYYVGVRAYHLTAQSPIGNTPSFTTEASTPPEPSFVYSPSEVKAGLPVTFDPTGTIDVDTPPDELLFKWDYNNDSVIDRITIGPELVQRTYIRRGPVTCKLIVSDGTT
jgi:hypothetical protein